MRMLDPADLLAIAAHVLECSTSAVLETTDLGTVEEVVAATRGDDVAAAAGTLLAGLVRRRPFVRSNRRIAVLATVHLALLNGCDLELGPVGELDELLHAVAAGTVPDTELADWLRGRLRRQDRPEPELEGTMFERFTDSARRIVNLAQEDARILNHSAVGTEHVLLAILGEGESVAARVLSDLGMTQLAVREAVREIVGKESGAAPSGHIPFTPRSKKLLELSLREALHLGHNYIGPEHILLGLTREKEGVGGQVLQKFGGDLTLIRERVMQALSGEETKQPRSRRRHLLQRELDAVLDENERLQAEVTRLRALLRDHGINPET